jgi:hypothetical protein
MSANSPSPSDLANRIAGPGRYKFDVLVEGIAAEQARLVSGPLLSLFWLRVFDFEGLTEWLVLGDAHQNIPDASQYIETQLDAFQLAQTRVRTSSGGTWEVENDRDYALPLKPAEPLRIQDTKMRTIYGGPYHRVYLCGHVIGPFPGAIVGSELFEMLHGLPELWHWFLSVGEARRSGASNPTITRYIQE